MKTKNLILMMAFFAFAIYGAYGQTLAPRALQCIDLLNPLSPVPGNPYTYTVDVPNPPGNKSYRWYVTQDPNFATNGAYNWGTAQTIGGPILAAGSGWYNSLTPNQPTISLTWQSFVLNPGQYVFVVIYVENTRIDDPLCTTNNLKVYRILPLHAFSLDIANVLDGTILEAGYGANIDHCISDVQSAVFDPINNEIDYDFGSDTLYYAIAAANYSGNWQLRVQLAGLQTSQTATITWGYTLAGVTAFPIAAGQAQPGGTFTAPDFVQIQGGVNTVGSAGQTIFIRMIIYHGTQFQGLATSQYSLAVNGNLVDGSGNPIPLFADVHHTGAAPCVQADFDDIALQSLTPRPTIQTPVGAPVFLPIGN